MRLLRQTWKIVSEVTIRSCFKKVNFIRLEAEDDVEEIENNGDRDIERLWEALQACYLISETCAITKYTESDANIVTCETVTDDSSDLVKAVFTPVQALTSMRQLDLFLRSHHDSEEMLHFLAKIEHYVVHKSISKANANSVPAQRLFAAILLHWKRLPPSGTIHSRLCRHYWTSGSES